MIEWALFCEGGVGSRQEIPVKFGRRPLPPSICLRVGSDRTDFEDLPSSQQVCHPRPHLRPIEGAAGLIKHVFAHKSLAEHLLL
jgi:hypothetical protein